MTTGSHSTVRIVAAAALCTGLGASLGFVPAFVATTLGDDLGISRAQIGLLVSVHFGCTGLASILGGRVTERFGARSVIAIDMVLVAFGAVFSAVVGSYWSLLVAAVAGGVGYALANAGTNVVIGRAVPVAQRTLAMSIKTAGVPFMAMVGAAIGPVVAAQTSWRVVISGIAVAAAGATVAALTTFADDRAEAQVEVGERDLPAGFWWFSAGAFLLIAGSQPLYSWTVAYLEDSLDASAGIAGAVSALASGLGILYMISSARSSDRLGPEHRVRRMIALLAVSAVATLLVLLGETLGIAIAAVGVGIGISAQLASIGTMHAAVVDRAPHAVARATGVTMTGYYIGALASPAAFGALADATGTFAWSWGATAALLVLALPTWAVAGRVVAPVKAPVRNR